MRASWNRLAVAATLLVCLGGAERICVAQGAAGQSGTGQAASSTVSLRPKWTAGRVDSYRFIQETSQTQAPAPGRDKGMDKLFRSEVVLEKKVISTSDSATTLELRVKRAKVEIRNADQRFEADTTKPESVEKSQPDVIDGNRALIESLNRIIDLPITVHLDKDAEVTDVTGNLSPDQDAKPYPQFIVGTMIVREALAPLYRLPSAPATAGTGQVWDRVDQNPSPPIGTIMSTAKMTVESVDGQQARMKITGKIEVSPAVGPSAIKVDIDSQRIEGQCVWDGVAGELALLSRTDKLELTLDTPVGPIPYRKTTIFGLERSPAPGPLEKQTAGDSAGKTH